MLRAFAYEHNTSKIQTSIFFNDAWQYARSSRTKQFEFDFFIDFDVETMIINKKKLLRKDPTYIT